MLCVKGSGWDMAVIEAPGLPAVKLAPLLKARALDRLSDEDMVALQRANLIDPDAPNPSIETLLHAFLPHKFVDHTHSTAILSLVDQEDSEAICRTVFGQRMGFVPYIKPGFDLAKAAAEIYEADPSVEGLILDKHGIFTFAEDAKPAYSLMIEFVTHGGRACGRERGASRSRPSRCRRHWRAPAEIAPMLRGAVAVDKGEGRFDRMVSEFRVSPDILEFVNADTVEDLALRGVSTPDLSIRIKTGPMVLPAPRGRRASTAIATVIDERVAAFSARYRDYFADQRRARRRQAHHARPDAAADAGARARPVRPRAHAEGRRASRPMSARCGSRRCAGPRRSARSGRCRCRTCSSSNTGRWSRPSSPPTSRSL